ncbi:MAG: alcohol dehydrogenase catalytic domain-containing protein [Eubacteriales bacterium]
MRKALLTEVGKIEVVEAAIPEIVESTDVQVKIKAVGICGTDLHIFKAGRADVQLPRVMGHELSGEVTAVGADVTTVKVGDKVVLDPVYACGTCPTCQKGYQNVCDSVKCYGVHMDGGFQDYIVTGEKHLYVVDEKISYEEAALAEPFSVAANILGRTMATANDNIIVIGSGTIGLCIVQAAVGMGARVMVADIADEKLAKAKEFGAEIVVNSKDASIEDAIAAFAPGGLDVVIDAVGVTPLFQASINYAAPRARIACIGFDAKPAEIPPVVVTKKELSIIGSRMNCYKFPTVMEWLNNNKIEAAKMVSKAYPVENIQEAFEYTLANPNATVKTLITF